MSVNFAEFFKKLKHLNLEDGEVLELELRLLIDSRTKSKEFTLSKEATINYAKSLIEKYKENEVEIEQTINIFSANEQTFKQLLFINGEKKKDHEVVRSKSRLINPVFMNNSNYFSYKLSASIEKSAANFDMTRVSFTRIKLRYSIDLNDDWRLDITLIKTINDISTNPGAVKNAKEKMFFAINKTNFADKAPWNEADLIEFELEYIGQLDRLSLESLKIADRFPINSDVEEAPQTQNSEYQQGVYEIAEKVGHKRVKMFTHKFGLKQLSNQVVELNKNMFIRDVLPRITDYYITDKVDGERNMLYLSPTKSFAVSSTIRTLPQEDIKTDIICIVDCEEYKGQFYIFDVLYYEKSLTELPFEERKAYFDKASKHFKQLVMKPFELLTEKFQEEIKEFKKRKLNYETDGLVLTPKNEKYFDMKCYKYKPISHLTIDFLIKECPESLLGVHPFVENKEGIKPMILFCGLPRNYYLNLGLSFIEKYEYLFPWVDKKNLPDYFPYQFQPCDSTYAYLFWPTEKETDLANNSPENNPPANTPTNNKIDQQDSKNKQLKLQLNTENAKKSPLDGLVGEFAPEAPDKLIWRLKRIRWDRLGDLQRKTYFGNAFQIAEQNWFSYKNPLLIESLDLKSNSYFFDKDTELQKNSRNFNSFVKSKIFDRFKNTNWTLDMASGNGQDLFRYADHYFKNVLFTEVDRTAIEELIYRKNSFAHNQHKNKTTKMFVSEIDFLQDYRKAIEKIETDHIIQPEKFDLIICNFAFHYFAKSTETLNNVATFANSMLKKDGQMVFTAFDGKKVVKLLNEHDGDYKVETTIGDQTHRIYGIRSPDYKVNYVSEIPGQQIEVLLPFSKNQYYKEYLITEKIAQEAFEKNGFIKISVESFGDFIPQYKNAMTDDDKEYVSLYSIYTFKKKESSLNGPKPSARRSKK